MGHDFMMASGKLQAICYKHEIEKTLRTPDYAGFQLLALNDYSGQGTALVGLLDVFFEEKGYINAAEFRRFCSPNSSASFLNSVRPFYWHVSPSSHTPITKRFMQISKYPTSEKRLCKKQIQSIA